MLGNFLSGAAGVFNDWATSAWKQDKAEGMMEDSQNFAADQATSAQQFSERMYDTRYQKTIADMKAAGLNPMLGYQQGPGTAPHGAIGNAPGHSTPNATVGSGNIAASAAQIQNIQADTDKKRAEADETRERTPTHAVSIDQMKANIENLIQQARTGASSAAHMEQQIVNLREQMPQIRALVENIKQHTLLTHEQTELSKEQNKHLQQQIAQNLPALEAALMGLEKVAREMAQPGQQADEAAKGSYIGQLGAYLKALLPLQGLVGAIPFTRNRTIIHNPPPITIRQPRQ